MIDRDQLIECLLSLIPDSDRAALLDGRVAAPTVEELMDHVRPLMLELRRWFNTKIDDLMLTLEQRGEEYGEEVLVVMGESGMHEMCKVKMWRAKGSMEQGAPITERHDTRIDIAGYQVLMLALAEWQEQGSGVRIV